MMRWTAARRAIEGVVVDVDGTLYVYDAVEHAQYLALARRCLRELAGLDARHASMLLRHLDEATNQGSVTALLEAEGVSRRQWTTYRARRWNGRRLPAPDPLLADAVARLAARIPVALVTNSSAETCDRVLAALGLPATCFSVLVSSDLGLRPKPAPDAFLHVATSLGCEPAALFGIGDWWSIDVEPLVALGGGGVEVRSPGDVRTVCARLERALDRGGSRISRTAS